MLRPMDVIRFGLGIRALRHRRRWTQEQLARRVGVSRSTIARIERGRADRVAVHTLVDVAAELGARTDVRLLWQGEALDRLLDARHAELVEWTVRRLDDVGWIVATEVSFNIRGERGSIDVLSFDQATGSLLVVEVKSVVPDLQAMLAGLDRKRRLAREIAHERGWSVSSVGRILVLPDDRTARRRVQAKSATLGSALPARTIEVRRWIRRPLGPIDGILFVTDDHQASTRHRVPGAQGAAERGPHPEPAHVWTAGPHATA